MVKILHKDTAEVLLNVPGNSLRGATLAGAQLAGADLSGMDLAHAVMRGSDLQGAVLDKAEMIGACLDGANLTQASLVGANLSDATLRKARMRRARLNGCQMRLAQLAGADLTRASLVGANLSLADLRADLSGAELRNADLRGADLTDATLIRADLADADFTGATMVRTTLTEAQLEGARFQNVITREVAASPGIAEVGTRLRASTVEEPEGGVSIQIRVECPHCGQPQRVSRACVEQYSTCPRCKEDFYLDHAGRPYASKPVLETDWTPEIAKSPSLEHPDWEWKPEWTKPAVMAGGAVLSLPFIWMIVSWMLSLSGPPEDLSGRAEYLGRAFAAADERRVVALCEPATDEVVRRWLSETRPSDWKEHLEKDGEFAVTSNVIFANVKSRYARVEVSVRAVPRSDGSAESSTVEFSSIWKLDPQDQWVLVPKTLFPEE